MYVYVFFARFTAAMNDVIPLCTTSRFRPLIYSLLRRFCPLRKFYTDFYRYSVLSYILPLSNADAYPVC